MQASWNSSLPLCRLTAFTKNLDYAYEPEAVDGSGRMLARGTSNDHERQSDNGRFVLQFGLLVPAQNAALSCPACQWVFLDSEGSFVPTHGDGLTGEQCEGSGRAAPLNLV